jgi:succinyl-diaminopimelate desuccinylase
MASDPFAPEVRDGQLYGRGAADMKTSLAAFVTPSKDFVAANPRSPGSIALLLTSDEEGDATHGTVRVVEALKARGEVLDYCIVGEPTSVDTLGDTIKNGRRGSLSGKLIVKGIQGHIAYPHLVRNPIHLAAPALAELAATSGTRATSTSRPPPGRCPTSMPAPAPTNVIPGTLEILFNFRFPPPARRKAEGAGACHPRRHGVDYDLAWTLGGRPFLTPRGKLVAAMEGHRAPSASKPNCPPPAAPPTAASSPTSARR